MDRTQQRYERFAQLRAANPTTDYDELMSVIHGEEIEQDERDHYAAIDAADEWRAQRYMDGY